MKRMLHLVTTLVVTIGLMCGCNEDETDARDVYVGDYLGTRTTTNTTNMSTVNNENTCSMKIKINESNSKSIVVYPSTSKEILFYTEGMKVVTIDGVDVYCGSIKSEVSEDEEGNVTTKEGVNISEKIPYSCAIVSNKDGGYTFMYSFKTMIETTYNTQVLQTDSFVGSKE